MAEYKKALQGRTPVHGAASTWRLLAKDGVDVGWVTLDPFPEMTPETSCSDGVRRERFVNWVLSNPCSFSPKAGVRRHARGLVGPA